MTTVLSQAGQLVLLSPGDDFEVVMEEDDTITLRRVSRPPSHGLFALLLDCPSLFAIPSRETDDSQALEP